VSSSSKTMLTGERPTPISRKMYAVSVMSSPGRGRPHRSGGVDTLTL
jgi:hypothetical protein